MRITCSYVSFMSVQQKHTLPATPNTRIGGPRAKKTMQWQQWYISWLSSKHHFSCHHHNPRITLSFVATGKSGSTKPSFCHDGTLGPGGTFQRIHWSPWSLNEAGPRTYFQKRWWLDFGRWFLKNFACDKFSLQNSKTWRCERYFATLMWWGETSIC